jgi:hypothetical protein
MVILIEDEARKYIIAKVRDKSIALDVVERPGGV